jgi:hypothetical protein
MGLGSEESDMFRFLASSSPDITPRDFLIWGRVKYSVFLPKLPSDIPENYDAFTGAVTSVFKYSLSNIWEGMGYGIDATV